jgi:uncharacterized Zn-binding protein involved in type VI secretion
MQRRWAAICLAFFLVTAAGGYAVMAVAEEPTIDVEGESYQANDTFEANGTTYAFTGDSFEYNETQRQETTWDNGSTVQYDDGQYAVFIENTSDPAEFQLRQQFGVESMLQNDTNVDNQTYEADDGTLFFRYRNGTTQPVGEYLPDPDVQTFSEGDTLEHEGQTKTVDNVTADAATLVWEEEVTQSIEASQGEVVEIGGQQYVPHYPEEGTVVLSEDVEGYQQQVENQEFFQQRLSGLMYVILFSLGSAFLLAAMAFMPRRG